MAAPRRRAGADADRAAAGRRPGRPRAGRAGGRAAAAAGGALWRDGLAEAVAAIRARAPTLRLTIDPVEFRGFRYDTGVSVTIFAPGRHEELGRGGRYLCGDARAGDRPDAVSRTPSCAPPRRARHGRACMSRRAPTRTKPRGCARLGYATDRRRLRRSTMQRPRRAASAAPISCATAAAAASDN